jgi:hypothetical protein
LAAAKFHPFVISYLTLQQIPLLSLDFVSAQQDPQHTTVQIFFRLLGRSAVS